MIRTTLTLVIFLALGLPARADEAAELTAFAKKHHASVSTFNAGMLALAFTDKTTDDDLAALEKSAPKNFQALELTKATQVTDEGFLQLKSLSGVLYLDLPRNISNKGVADFKKRFPAAIQIRYIAEENKGTLANEGVKAILEVESLRVVSLNHGRFDDAIWESLGKCPKLRSIAVQSSSIKGKGIAALKACTELSQLYLFDCPLADGVAKSIAKIPALWSLTLNGCTLTDDEMAPLAEMPALQHLTLLKTAVGDEGLLKLAPSKSLTNVLGVSTKISNDGIEKLKKLNPKIQVNN